MTVPGLCFFFWVINLVAPNPVKGYDITVSILFAHVTSVECCEKTSSSHCPIENKMICIGAAGILFRFVHVAKVLHCTHQAVPSLAVIGHS